MIDASAKRSKPGLVVIGAGGHATVVIDVIINEGRYHAAACIDADPTRWGTETLGVPIVGGDSKLPELLSAGLQWFVIGVGGAENPSVRVRLFEQALAAGLRPATLVHPSASVSEHAQLAAGTVAMAQATVSPAAKLGRNVIVNTGAIVEHDVQVSDHAHLCPGAKLAGNVKVGREALIGMGAMVKQGVSIGDRATVGMGAVVLNDVSTGSVVVGNPARVLQEGHGHAEY